MTTNIDFESSHLHPGWDPPDNDAMDADPDAAERAERGAAQQRYAQYLTNTHEPPTPSETIANAVLFMREGSDPVAVDMQDVAQRNLDDCFLHATLAAVAQRPAGQALLQHAIAENRNGGGDVVSYTVTLHKPEYHLFGLGRTTFTDVKVTVDASFLRGHAKAREDRGQHEVWPLVMEKAYAQYVGDDGHFRGGGFAYEAMEIVTGMPAQLIELGLFHGYSASRLQSDLAAGKIVTFKTRNEIDPTKDDCGLVGCHEYTVTGLVQIDGKPCVTLHNPYGQDHPPPIPYDRVRDWFEAVSVGSVP